MASEYMPFVACSSIIFDISEKLGSLMWAYEKGGAMTVMDNIFNVVYLSAIIFGVKGVPVPNLIIIGIVEVATGAFYLFMVYVECRRRGWLSPFEGGLFRNLAMKNWRLVKGVLIMSIPLTFGAVMEQCEFELLTLFAAYMGQAEVAAWTITGAIWSIFENIPVGYTTAAEVRIGRHLGKGNPSMAKIAAYKCLFSSVTLSVIMTAFFILFKDSIVDKFTNNETIKEMIGELAVLLGIANVVMVIGVDAYTILCAQNRVRLASSIYVFISWLTIIPMSVYFVFEKGYDLQAILFSMIVGYSVTSLLLMVLVFSTNWTSCSNAVIRRANKIADVKDDPSEGKTTATINQDEMTDESSSYRILPFDGNAKTTSTINQDEITDESSSYRILPFDGNAKTTSTINQDEIEMTDESSSYRILPFDGNAKTTSTINPHEMTNESSSNGIDSFDGNVETSCYGSGVISELVEL
jgi:Na+-driven multidrug efflux pump